VYHATKKIQALPMKTGWKFDLGHLKKDFTTCSIDFFVSLVFT